MMSFQHAGHHRAVQNDQMGKHRLVQSKEPTKLNTEEKETKRVTRKLREEKQDQSFRLHIKITELYW